MRAKHLVILIFLVHYLCPSVISDDSIPIPASKNEVNSWFTANVQPASDRKNLDPKLAKAESKPKHIKVSKDGKGDFKTVSEAIKSVPKDNTQRVIISIGGGNYTERVLIEREKPFITLYGDPKDMPSITFHSTAAKDGTVASATVIVEADYFTAVNLNILNTELHVLDGVITAQARHTNAEDTGYSFVHCKITGHKEAGFLGRGWMAFSRVIYAYTEMTDAVRPLGWHGVPGKPHYGGTTYFGEYKNTGPGAKMDGRPNFAKKMTDEEVKPFITLGFIEELETLIGKAMLFKIGFKKDQQREEDKEDVDDFEQDLSQAVEVNSSCSVVLHISVAAKR
nr:pectinesterase 1-like [Ipomoea batatas]